MEKLESQVDISQKISEKRVFSFFEQQPFQWKIKMMLFQQSNFSWKKVAEWYQWKTKKNKRSSLENKESFHRIFLWLLGILSIFASHDSDALIQIVMFSNKKTLKKDKLVDWRFEGTQWIKRVGEKKNLEIVLSWNWKRKSISGILETKAFQ